MPQQMTTKQQRKAVGQQERAVHTRDTVVKPLLLKATQDQIVTTAFRAYMKQDLPAISLEALTSHLAAHSLILVTIEIRVKSRSNICVLSTCGTVEDQN
jgi:hypothetical protein